MITNWTSGLIAFSIRDFAEVFPDQKEQITKSTVDDIERWQTILAWNFQGLRDKNHGNPQPGV